MGNDAAHDIKKPKDESLSVALQIVEHLIASVYILENKAVVTLKLQYLNFLFKSCKQKLFLGSYR